MNDDAITSLNCAVRMTGKFLVLAICLHGALQLAVQGGKIDNKLTDAEFQKIFHCNRNEAFDYKTAMLKTSAGHRSKRDVRPVEFKIGDTTVQLKLTPIRENVMKNIPVWTAETDRKTSLPVFRKLSREETKIDGSFYEDPENMATVLAYFKDNHIYYDGVFGESSLTKIVRSFPEKWWRKSIDSEKPHDDHVIIDVNKANGTTIPLGSPPDSERLDKPLDVMYPKILFVVANDHFDAMGRDITETLKYVSTFWNNVNLKYRRLTSPKVKIVITGIIISKDDTALSYIYKNRNPQDMSQINSDKLLQDANNYFHNEFNQYVNFKNYDAVITITHLNSGDSVGAAYLGKICSDSDNVGFVKDDFRYNGIFPATHELGHLLNLPHDQTYDAISCASYPEPKVSTIMAPNVKKVEKYVWSDCSQEILRQFASKKAAECLRYPYHL